MDQQELDKELTLPSSVHAEMTILGGCLVDEVAIVDATTLLKPSDFFLDSHRRIFSIICGLHKEQQDVDIVTVGHVLRQRRELDAVGGITYLASLSEGLPRKLSIESYARIVHDNARARDLYQMVTTTSEAILANDLSISGVIDKLKAWTAEIEEETGTDAPMESVGQYLDRTFLTPEEVFSVVASKKGVPSGMAWFDEKTGGFVAGRLYVIGARPSMGKTAYAVENASNVSLKGKEAAALFTFEQPKEELIQRMLCSRATASLDDFIKGRSDSSDRHWIMKAMEDFKAAPLYWDENAGLTASQIRARIIKLQKSLGDKKLKVVFIDQLSFMRWDDVFEKGLRTDQLIGAMTRALKRVAKELQVAIVLFCQLKRGSEKNKDSEPTLSDLKESGAIEENADVVAFLHRAEYYDRTDPSIKGKGKLILAKNRMGAVGSHMVKYISRSCKWTDEWTPKDGDDDGTPIPY